MADLLQTGASFLQAQRHAHMAHEVLYVRGGPGGTGLTIKATVGRSTFERRDSEGNVFADLETRDFTFRASDLAIAGVPFTPDERDQVIETIGDRSCEYGLVRSGPDRPWRYEDMSREAIRVHTVKTSEGPA